ncbi:SDR family oxidoreductase [Ferrovibrio sp.]|uniref:SDR family NAD(P)-dependent oxidoreductase n=1 Tax=Ferrovibrio sp. TaxID=1917215 RepID=UPI000CA94E7A|nr:SDR family NAD(P)-dependent oxidoreductase [Ferrovibrio sp.]PJI43356.1 MAG: short-chain dehydrogenase [Ferrovibrio sp.]
MGQTELSGIVITGASSGIGQALAELYARPGVLLALTGRDATRLAAVAEACRQRGATVEAETVPVTDQAAMQIFIEKIAARSRLDLVIANAGVSGGFKDWDAFDAYVRSITSVNIDGVLNTVNPAIPVMVQQRSGQIAIVASIAGFLAMPGAVPYSATKHFARAYAEELRGRLAREGVRVSAICPGFVTTRMTARNRFPMPFLMDEQRAARIIADGLVRDKGRIAFPWPMLAMVRLLGLLPYPLLDWILRRSPAKS